MSKKIIAVNAGPEMGWEKEALITEASKGAESTGAVVERFDLFRLEKYAGCISCFGCKKDPYTGHCVCRDGLTPVLDAIQKADGLMIGFPGSLTEITTSVRSLYDRLIIPKLTDNFEIPGCNEHPIPVLLIVNCNGPDTVFIKLLRNYQQILSHLVGPTEVFISGNIIEPGEYNKTGWNLPGPEEKQERQDTICTKERKKVFQLGFHLAS